MDLSNGTPRLAACIRPDQQRRRPFLEALADQRPIGSGGADVSKERIPDAAEPNPLVRYHVVNATVIATQIPVGLSIQGASGKTDLVGCCPHRAAERVRVRVGYREIKGGTPTIRRGPHHQPATRPHIVGAEFVGDAGDPHSPVKVAGDFLVCKSQDVPGLFDKHLVCAVSKVNARIVA